MDSSHLVLAMFSGEVSGEVSMTALGWSASDARALGTAWDSSFRMARSLDSSLLSRFLVDDAVALLISVHIAVIR